MSDVIDAALNPAGRPRVREIRQAKAEVLRRTEAIGTAIFDGPAGRGIGAGLLFHIAARVAELGEAHRLAEHYRTRAAEHEFDPDGPRVVRARTHAELVTAEPARAGSDDVAALEVAGFDPEAIVTLSQLIGFVNYQVRVIAGLDLLGSADS